MRVNDICSCWLTLNRECNLRCKWCYSQTSAFSKSDTMSFEIAKDLSKICAECGIKKMILIGGEPLMYEKLPELISWIVQLGVDVSICTNGINFKDLEYCKEIKKAGGDHFGAMITLKGLSNEVYLRDCGFASFDDVLLGIRNCRKTGIFSTHGYIVSAENVDGLTSFAQDYVRLGLKDIPLGFAYCSDFIPEGANCQSCYRESLSCIEVDRRFNCQYEMLYDLLGSRFTLHQTLPLCMCDQRILQIMKERNQLATSCHVMTRSGLVLNTDGALLMCNHLFGYGLGGYGKTYHDTDSFKSFFESKEVENIRNQLTTMPSESCMNCPNAEICGGGCCLRWFTTSYDELITLKRKERR